MTMKATGKAYEYDHANECETTVAGKRYLVWADFGRRCMMAQNEEGTVLKVKGSGYITEDLTARKAIALAFNLPTFRK